MIKTNRLASEFRVAGFLFVLIASALLQGCGGGGSSTPPPPPPIDAGSSYYDSLKGGNGQIYSDTNNTTLVTISDLQAIVKGDQLMLVSVTENVAWFAKLTKLDGGSYTADVNVYKDNNPLGKATLTGTITSGMSITGTLTGAGIAYGNGTFSLDISAENTTKADLATITRISPNMWNNGSSVSTFTLYLDGSGAITGPAHIITGSFLGCATTGNATAIANSALYQFNINLRGCSATAANGTYTGYTVTRSASTSNDTLVMVLENNTNGYSMYGEAQ